MTRPLAIALLLSLLATAGRAADDPAKLAPADAGVYIELHDLAALRDQWRDDPFMQRIEARLPAQRNPDAWRFIQFALNMTGQQIIDTYFNHQVVLIAQRPGEGEPAVILTRIDPADAQTLIDGLVLQKTATVNDFHFYEPQDGGSRIAFGGAWMAIADQRHEPFLLHVVESIGGARQLADDPTFQQWMARLPAKEDRSGAAFLRNDEGVHAMGLISRDTGFTLHYAGQSRRFAPMLANLGDAATLDTRLAPPDAMLVAAVNLRDAEPRHKAFLDRLIAPRTFDGDLAPAIGSPIVAWMDRLEQDDDAAPVFGLAMRTTHADAGVMLDLAVDRALVLVNVATMRWGIPPLVPEAKSAGDRTYHVVPVNEALRQRVKLAALQHTNLAYGQAGDWYVITTNEQAYLDAAHAAASAANNAPNARRPIAMVSVKGRAMAAHLSHVADHLPRRAREHEHVSRLRAMTPWLERYDTMTLQLEADDADIVHATLDVTR